MYVGNLSFETTEEEVRELFAPYGKIESIDMAIDRLSGKFRGFCFLEMENKEANAAIAALDNYQLGGRTLRINEARPHEDRKGGPRRGADSRGGYKRSR